jgi:hypothetical protein
MFKKNIFTNTYVFSKFKCNLYIRIRIQQLKIMRIRIRNPAKPETSWIQNISFEFLTHFYILCCARSFRCAVFFLVLYRIRNRSPLNFRVRMCRPGPDTRQHISVKLIFFFSCLMLI